MAKTIVSDVIHCARCGENHDRLTFSRLANPINDNDGTLWDYFAMCPTLTEPILLKYGVLHKIVHYAHPEGLTLITPGKISEFSAIEIRNQQDIIVFEVEVVNGKAELHGSVEQLLEWAESSYREAMARYGDD